MKLSEIKNILKKVESVDFKLASGDFVPEHFHVTEIGLVTKHFIDCGGTQRHEKVINFQLWNANDVEHRLKPQKLLDIISLSEKALGLEDFPIEVEYQSDTIGKYGLEFEENHFNLIPMHTACLASDNCGKSSKKEKATMKAETSCCTPGSGSC
jgi:hypothetical protein